MNLLLLSLLVVCIFLVVADAKPSPSGDVQVEIEKQRLVKFPDDIDQRRNDDDDNADTQNDKQDEAKRILEEIAKINEALGYVKKQPEQPKIPPILDSSQYLFPKPAYHPFHSQNHQIAGSHGETLLVPSIRAVKFDERYSRDQAIEYNVPPNPQPKDSQKIANSSTSHKVTPQLMSIKEYQQYLAKLQSPKSQLKSQTQYFYRPNQVHIPAPQNGDEHQQLPTHFVIPVRLYKLNKEQYLRQHAPHEYRVKGYKIVGDIDNFYGKAKTKTKLNKPKTSPKYHLFFLPHELALNDADSKHTKVESSENHAADTSSREEKLANRPFKIQATASTVSGNSNSTASTQIVRKRIIPKPFREKETNVGSVATGGSIGAGTAATTIHITPPPIALISNVNSNNNPGGSDANTSPNANTNNNNNNNNFGLFNRPFSNLNFNSNSNSNQNNTKTNSTAANVIKTAFQNIFKFPFRQDIKPEAPMAELTNMESVPLQIPQKTFFVSQGGLQPPQPFYSSQTNVQEKDDYKWDDNDNDSDSNSADEELDESPELEEKKIFGHHHQQLQDTQKEALRQGGIIIQRLKVRRGGIAIAGPGGVATAGSGGTAIVGPGGYALTHPRSLTIAGPGAKVIAIPANVDLKDALQRTNLRSKIFPREGKVVATGPTVYYSPATGVAVEI